MYSRGHSADGLLFLDRSRVGTKGQEEAHNRNWAHVLPQGCFSSFQERVRPLPLILHPFISCWLLTYQLHSFSFREGTVATKKVKSTSE